MRMLLVEFAHSLAQTARAHAAAIRGTRDALNAPHLTWAYFALTPSPARQFPASASTHPIIHTHSEALSC